MEKNSLYLYILTVNTWEQIKNTKPFIISQNIQQQSDCCSQVSQLLASPVLREDTSPSWL